MEHPLIHDRGRGPELVGTRTTIYNLVPYFLNADRTEAEIAEWNRITVEQVAAMRAYFFAHFVEVMTEHEKIEARIRKGMEEQRSPEFQSRFWWNRERLERLRDWITEHHPEAFEKTTPGRFKQLRDEFRAWLESRETVGAAQ